MELTQWIPPLTTTALFAAALWLARNLIANRLARSVEHEFNAKLELLRADLRSKEVEISELRSAAMTALASRQVALDKRRLDAVDQLWAAATELGKTKIASSLMAIVKFEAAVNEAERNPAFRSLFEAMGAAMDLNKLDVSCAAKARPFVTPMAWAYYSACQAIAMQAVAKLHQLKFGIGGHNLIDKDRVKKLVTAALPHHEAYIEKYGDGVYGYLLEDLENRLLEELRKMLTGVETDRASVERAAEIVRLSNDVQQEARQSGMPSNDAL